MQVPRALGRESKRCWSESAFIPASCTLHPAPYFVLPTLRFGAEVAGLQRGGYGGGEADVFEDGGGAGVAADPDVASTVDGEALAGAGGGGAVEAGAGGEGGAAIAEFGEGAGGVVGDPDVVAAVDGQSGCGLRGGGGGVDAAASVGVWWAKVAVCGNFVESAVDDSPKVGPAIQRQ
jgi:hypothetical protein